MGKQLNDFISEDEISNVHQSAIRSFRSTETAPLNIQYPSVDLGKAAALTLSDLSTAFNIIDHSILHDCLKDWFGVDGTVLTWID